MYKVLGSLTDYLNDNLLDPYGSGRVGSHIFGPDLDMNFNKYTPKGQVSDESQETDDYSFGNNPKRTRFPIVNVYYYVNKHDVYNDSGVSYKGRRLVWFMLDKIENAVGSATGSGLFTGAHVVRTGMCNRVPYVPERQIYVGAIPISFKSRTI